MQTPELLLPAELLKFLRTGQILDYDVLRCEAGQVALKSPDALVLSHFQTQTFGTPLLAEDPHQGRGSYEVVGVDLIASCTGDYDPEGLLVWFPQERRFGVHDPDHDILLIFSPQVGWAEIVAEPAKHLTASIVIQGDVDELEHAPTEHLIPWYHAWNG